LIPDFCAISDSETSIEFRSIINSPAASKSLSAVVDRPVSREAARWGEALVKGGIPGSRSAPR
jgi:hypothetical protein